MKCGEKTRRGGAQDTVRISVLEQLEVDHPEWTLTDVIAHLNGSDGQEFDCDASSTPETDCSESSNPQTCVESFETFNILDFVDVEGSLEPLSMEFITPGT
jgi:hypothetical protein